MNYIQLETTKVEYGAPVWQFRNGRAVLIGVRSDYFPEVERNSCDERNTTSYGFMIKVVPLMPWIVNTTSK